MKIAICSTFLGQKTSGGEISAFHLAENLSSHGEKIFAVTAKIGHKLPFRAYEMPLLRMIPNILLLIGSPIFDYYMTARMRRLFSRERPDIVHVQDSSILIPALRAAGSVGVPVVMTVRDYRFTCNLSTCMEDNRIEYNCDRRTYRRCLRRSLQEVHGKGWLEPFLFPFFHSRRKMLVEEFTHVKRYIAVSDFVSNEIIRSGISKDRIVTIKVQKEDWNTSGGGTSIFTAGGIKGTKGFDFLLKAFCLVVRKRPDAMLRIAGDGSARVRLEAMAKNLGIDKNLIFLGKLGRERIMKEYENCAFVVSPSLWPEPLSRIIFEAFSSRKTIVATDVGGSGEMVKDGKTGLLVKPWDEKGLGEAMIRLLDDRVLRERFAKAGYEMVCKCCSADVNYEAHKKIYEQVAG